MTGPLQKPGRKNPLAKTSLALLPPQARSVPSLGLLAGAALGRFALQRCGDCGTFLYPVRDVCPECLGQSLSFEDAPTGGQILSETLIEVTADPYFRGRPPVRQGLVLADCGARMVVLLHRACAAGGRVRLSLKIDRAGQAAVFAHPETGREAGMEDDPAWQELTAQPKFRRVLITDGRSPVALPLAQMLLAAGADQVNIGISERWKPDAGLAALEAITGVTLFDLDLRDERSVQDLATALGGKTDILVNTAHHYRPGSLFQPGEVLRAKDALDISALGLMRLAHSFGPAMASRGGDGVRSAVAWVNVLSIWAASGRPASAGYAAAQAAALSVAQSLRAELAQGGVRVMNVFTGALDDPWFEGLPPPKVAPQAVAKGILGALSDGIEETFIGVEAEDYRARLSRNPKEIERLMWRGEGQ